MLLLRNVTTDKWWLSLRSQTRTQVLVCDLLCDDYDVIDDDNDDDDDNDTDVVDDDNDTDVVDDGDDDDDDDGDDDYPYGWI